MSQHDFNIANAPGATVRSDINSAFEAIVTNNSGASAPSTTFANMWWFDTANNLLKIRDASNTNWITVASKSGTTWTPYYQGAALGNGCTADLANQAEAEAGSNNTKLMTPLRTAQSIAALKAFGTMVSKSSNTVYQAATDGFFFGWYASSGQISVKVGASNPPTTEVSISTPPGTPYRRGFCYPVNKDFYYMIETTSDGALYFMPSGT